MPRSYELGRPLYWTGAMRTSENVLKAKFAELLFHDVG